MSKPEKPHPSEKRRQEMVEFISDMVQRHRAYFDDWRSAHFEPTTDGTERVKTAPDKTEGTDTN